MDDPYVHAGSAYVFHRHAGGTNNWGQIVKLTPSDFSSDHAFGQSVSVAGNIVVVGAPYDDGAGASSGSAYVFDIATHTSSARAPTRVTHTRNR